jgi:tetratricopeptide (TPR) repeat protein
MLARFMLRGAFCSRLSRARNLFPACLVLALFSAPSVSRADVIYLKNGRKIVAPITRQDSKQVFYELGQGEVAIPRSLIDRIEKSSQPVEATEDASPSPGSRTRQEPLPPPPGVATTPSGDSPVVKGGAIDEAYLRHLDNAFADNPAGEIRSRLKRDYQEAAIFETRNGDPEAGLKRYRHALRLLPGDLTLTLGLGYLLITQNHYLEAMDLLLPASDRHPQSPDVHMLLGSVFYGQEDLDQAIAEWNKALAIADNPRLRQAVAKAEKERSIAGSYQELRSEHFLLRHEGSVPRAFSGEVLKTLDQVFFELERDLDFYPSETIVVLLYPNQAFRDITRSPGWVGAVNDGKLRIPVSGLNTMTPEVARVLKHELTHSFVGQITLGRCPTWFNEGLAQLEEGATTAGLGSQLARAFSAVPPYPALEGSFMSLPANAAELAYAKSLAALEYLRDTQGQGEIRRLLKAMPANPDLNSLLQNELRLDYPAFEQEVATYVEKRYGSP